MLSAAKHLWLFFLMSESPVTRPQYSFLVPEGRPIIAPGKTRGTAPPKEMRMCALEGRGEQFSISR